jgi:hypothetical protein
MARGAGSTRTPEGVLEGARWGSLRLLAKWTVGY